MIKYYYIVQKGILFKYWIYSTIFLLLIFLVLIFNANFFNINTYANTAILTLKGNNAYSKNLWGDAGIFYSKAIENNEEPAKMKFNLANSYFQQGRYQEAIVIYDKLSDDKTVTFKAAVFNNMAVSYYKRGRLLPSVEALKSAIVFDDKDDEVRRNFLFVYDKFLKSLIRPHASTGKEDKKTDQEGTKTDNPNTTPEGKEAPFDQTPGKYTVSDREMNRLLTISKQRERVPKGTKGGKVNSTANAISGPDY